MSQYTIRMPDDLPELDPVPVRVGYWYDRADRAWVVELVNARGEGLGEALYVGNGKAAALALARGLAAGLPVGPRD